MKVLHLANPVQPGAFGSFPWGRWRFRSHFIAACPFRLLLSCAVLIIILNCFPRGVVPSFVLSNTYPSTTRSGTF